MYVIEQEKRELKLIHDVKHRWNSMTNMVTRFLRIYKCVNHALLDLRLNPLSETEIQMLTQLNNTLKPLETAVNELSKNYITLVKAEGIFQFMFSKISKFNNPLVRDLLERLK